MKPEAEEGLICTGFIDEHVCVECLCHNNKSSSLFTMHIVSLFYDVIKRGAFCLDSREIYFDPGGHG